MKTELCIAAILSLTACGVETVGTAATAASLKKQEVEQGKESMERFQQKLDQANQQLSQHADQTAEAAK